MPRPSSKIMSTGPVVQGSVNNDGLAGAIVSTVQPDPDTPERVNKPKVIKALGKLSAGEAKARRKDLTTALKEAKAPLDADDKAIADAQKRRDAAVKAAEKAKAAVDKDADKATKAIDKELAALAKARAKHDAGYAKGAAKINEQLAALDAAA